MIAGIVDFKKFCPKLFFNILFYDLNLPLLGAIVACMAEFNVALENTRSLYNVGSVLRTSSFFGLKKLFLIGYSGKRLLPNGKYEIHEKIAKTSLGSWEDVLVVSFNTSEEFVTYCASEGITVLAVEQASNSKSLYNYNLPEETSVLVFGNEKDGVSKVICDASQAILEIPRTGIHNSLNVSVACAVVVSFFVKK